MNPPEPNGWSAHERLVLYRLDRIEARLDSLSHDVQSLITTDKARSLKLGVMSFSIAATTAFGGRALWDLVLSLL